MQLFADSMLQYAHIILQVLEDRNRALDEEVSELRELRDQDGVSGNVRELELELKVSTSVHAIHTLAVVNIHNSKSAASQQHTLLPALCTQQSMRHSALQELRHEFEEERKANDKLIEASDRDKQTIDSLEAK